ncbi:DUF2235 domain-containing protein [Bradyrhizobium sp. SZCCHNS2002]|uniref:DUF2235 domain-containing protein n=1 Tax=Bradyrhizobium sp. SZCCHNS2002 TaxID=3057302 RepID=UPI002916F883|nr:DUF2235 domain-containing protein [Bradyrhizobium sp. SZCCHNS2002]
MGKNIVLLSDGTGNSAANVHKTNIWRLYRALSTEGLIAEYDDGVGTSSFRPLALIGGAFGIGLAKKVRHLYAFLSRNYRDEEDKVFAFGFSRGAYTIRMLIGLVANQGLVDPNLPEEDFQVEIRKRWGAFRRARFSWRGRVLGIKPAQSASPGRVPTFEFVGLWDTVGAYGLPIDELQYAIDLYIYPFSFQDRQLSNIVKCAYHALALDDERRTFFPVLWNEENEESDPARIQQVWFAGSHANVGGGYPKDGLAYVSLQWIVTKAQQLGLKFLDDDLREVNDQASAHDDLYNSRAGLAGYYRYSPRPITMLCHDDINKVTIDRPKIHESVFQRIGGGRVAYGPIGIPPVYELVSREVGPRTGKSEPGAKGVGAQPDGKPERDHLEDSEQATVRATRMEAVWNVVWWRRIVFFLTLFSSLYLVAFPLFPDAMSTRESFHAVTEVLARYLGPALTVASYVMPNWVAKTWLTKFGQEPLLFLFGSLCVAVTMLIGSWLEEIIQARAEDIWHAKVAWPSGVVPKWAADPKSTRLYKLRSNPTVIRCYRIVAWRVLPTLTLACAVLLVLVVGWQWRLFDYVVIYGMVIVLVVSLRNWAIRG